MAFTGEDLSLQDERQGNPYGALREVRKTSRITYDGSEITMEPEISL